MKQNWLRALAPNDTGLTHGSSTDTEPAQARNSSNGELAQGSRKLFHSSSTDSGLSMSSSSDASRARKRFCDFTTNISSSSESGITSHSDNLNSITDSAPPANPEASDSPPSPEFASGVQAVSEQLQAVLSCSVPPPPARQSPWPGAATSTASGASVAASGVEPEPEPEPEPAGGSARSQSVASTAAGNVSLMDLSESGTDLETSEMDLDASKRDLKASRGEVGFNAARLGTNEADLGVVESNLITGDDFRGASDTDRDVSEAHLGVLGPDTVATERTVPDAGSVDVGIGTTDTCLLDLEYAAEPSAPHRDAASCGASTVPVPASSTFSPVANTESDSALTTEAESEYVAGGEESLYAVSESGSDYPPARGRHSALVKSGSWGQTSPLTRAVDFSAVGLHVGVGGRGRALTGAGKVPVAFGEPLDAAREGLHVESKSPGVKREVMDIEAMVSEHQTKCSEVAGTLGCLGLGTEQTPYELDSDDSEDSWDAGDHPADRLLGPLRL